MDPADARCLIQFDSKLYGMEIECLESNHYRSYSPAVHVHPSYHLILISKGGNLAEIDGREPVELKLNSLLFINPLVPHRFEIKKGGEVEHTCLIWRFRDERGAYALFPLQLLRGRETGGAAPEPYMLKDVTPFEASLFVRKHRQARETRAGGDEGFSFSMQAFELFFLGLDLITQGQAAKPQDPHRQLVAKVKAVVESEMVQKELDIPGIASRVGMHPNYVNAVFKRQEGITMNHYIRNRRIELAKSIMQTDPGRPVSDVAALCGFSQHSYFTRTFHKLCGVSPAEFRASAGSPSLPVEEG